MDSSGAPEVVHPEESREDSTESREILQSLMFPRYQVADEIGRGGMAFVFRGWDTTERRAVAIKVLKKHLGIALGPTRFLREIRLLGQLHHRGILPVLDSGHTEALYYFVMPLVDGETLERRLEREPQLPLDEVRRIVSQVAAALDYAHDAGIIHRDIKPSNLFLTGGQTLLADFGIAKDLSPSVEETTTSTGLVVGTSFYMSPEQADGHQHADRRADIYSLGCVAYQMMVGDPPFTGPNPQAILARHRTMPMPSVRVIRPQLPAGVDAVLRKALAKSPADRYQRAGDFADALSDPAKLAAAAREEEAEQRPVRRWRLPALVLAAIAGLIGIVLLRPSRPLADEKVVVFPMGENPPRANQEGVGIGVALMIGSALEYTDPLVWIDGLPRLDERLRGDAGALTATEARRITRAAGARWYLDGTVVRRGDSATVIVRLNDARGDSVVGRASASRSILESAQAGLDAVNQLLPRLLAPGQRVADLSALADRHPAAVAMWLQGEREYRRYNFARALDFERRAVKEDSALAVAAIRGAQAANWLNDTEEASALADAAVRQVALLPGRVAPLARGLQAYLNGRADAAVVSLRQALETSPQWTEAHMSLGEVYYHLLPSAEGRLDSLAEAEFTAAALDSGFSLPRAHLAEIAIRSGDTTRAMRAMADFLRLAPDSGSSDKRSELLLMLACARGGRASLDWREGLRVRLHVLVAAKQLAVAAAYPGCAEDGFRMLFEDTAASLGERWGALLGLQGVLAAEGRTSELKVTIESAIAAGLGLARHLYVLDALGGVNVESDAGSAASAAIADPKTPASMVWLAGVWHAHLGNSAMTRLIRDSLVARGARDSSATTGPYVRSLNAGLALLRGDTAAAVGALRTLLASAPQTDLDWDLGAPLAPDRMLLARLLLAQGHARDAIRTAAAFDHPTPIVFLPYLPASLELRRRAAEALGETREARTYMDRLTALGASQHLATITPSSIPEAP
ncbi:MAG: protein kinase [Gemmatimonadales bacterium]